MSCYQLPPFYEAYSLDEIAYRLSKIYGLSYPTIACYLVDVMDTTPSRGSGVRSLPHARELPLYGLLDGWCSR